MNAHLKNVAEKGYSVIPRAFDPRVVSRMRRIVLENLHCMSNTRPTKMAYHIPGFQRFPSLEPLHNIISSCASVKAVLEDIYLERDIVALGLTDITINRSQLWHTDLLRGTYSNHLSKDICWGIASKPCLKILVYLQDGASLQVVPGSHNIPIDLSDDKNVVPSSGTKIERVRMTSGDVILMDIRLIHRGSTEAEMEMKGLGDDAKILISSVFGDRFSRLAQAMQVGNARRMIDWDNRNGHDTRT
jgi:hypothetical protein